MKLIHSKFNSKRHNKSDYSQFLNFDTPRKVKKMHQKEHNLKQNKIQRARGMNTETYLYQNKFNESKSSMIKSEHNLKTRING